MVRLANQANESIHTTPALLKNQQTTPTKPTENKGFGAILQDTLNKVSAAEQTSDKKTELLAKGKIDDLHDVMITAQKANITVETAVQVQQKVIDTYNEMMRMQI